MKTNILGFLFVSFLILTVNAEAESAKISYNLGDKTQGGTVFYINIDGTHGLVAANIDQGKSYLSNGEDICSDFKNYDAEGQYFSDWVVPTRKQLDLIYENRDLIGSFQEKPYMSRSGSHKDFKAGKDYHRHRPVLMIRCVRHF